MIFELELSEHSKTHLIIHVMLLKSASDNVKLAKIMNIKEYENQNYVIKKILEKDQIDETDYYLIKWKSYDNSENIWESIKYLEKT